MLQDFVEQLSNHRVFQPASTGAPRYDLYSHLSNLPQTARVDFEDHSVIGNLIFRVEPGPGPSDTDNETESKIVSIPYAMRVLGNLEDAIEFIRCVRLIAGDDARSFNLQIIASHYYKEARARPVNEVLKEMGLLAIHLTSVTATIEDRLFDEPLETVAGIDTIKELSLSERRALFDARALEALSETENETSFFEFELQAISRFQTHTQGFACDEYATYFREQESMIENIDELDSLYETFTAVYDQYDEDHAVSLHMTDGERVVVVGSLDDDIDEESLPEESRHLAQELYDLFTNGFPLIDCGETQGVEGVTLLSYSRDPQTGERFAIPMTVFGLDTWLDYSVDAVYNERVLRTVRNLVFVPVRNALLRRITLESVVPQVCLVETNKRGVTTQIKEVRHLLRRVECSIGGARLHEQTSTVEVCPDAGERDQTRAVLEILLERWKTDFHLRSLNLNKVYRDLNNRLETARDTALIAQIKKEAWQYKEKGQLSIKLFTSLMTRANVRGAALESEPLKVIRTQRFAHIESLTATNTSPDNPQKFVLIQPLINQIPSLKGGTLCNFALKLHALPRQEKERVSTTFQTLNPDLYLRVRDGLKGELERASPKRLSYFRWALYPNNKPDHPVHILTQEDRSEAWKLLKELSRPKEKVSSNAQPLPVIAESTKLHTAAATA